MTIHEPAMIIITGIMASGKSTIAQYLAERFSKSVHLRGDVFRRMIVKGRIDMEPRFSQAAYDQLRLRYQLAATAANTYYMAGFTVIYQDVIIGPILKEVVETIKKSESLPTLHLIVLCPSPEVVAQREAARNKIGYASWSPADLDQALRSDTPRLGLWLDTSILSVEETVDTIIAQLDKAVV
jgi:predicted kinase